MKIRMELLSDTIFGNGKSIPGGEDISVLCDEMGFPYYKGGTFKGIFREELEQYIIWTGGKEELIFQLLGKEGNSDPNDSRQIVFSDFHLSDTVKERVLEEVGDNPAEIMNAFTNLRTFTKIEKNGIVSEGSLRFARCVNKGLVFYSEVICPEEAEDIFTEVIGLVKWIGSMRNRGFGNVKITKEV